MCGRYAGADTFEGLSPKLKKGLRQYKASNQFYNAAPSNHLPVITSQEPDRVQEMQWGLVRRYEQDFKTAFKPINARAETLADKPTFHDLLKKYCCVIPANSFYEWKKMGNGKIPYRFSVKNKNAFFFAGLWDEWVNKETGEVEKTFLIITTEPNELLKVYHNRMPVILSPESSEAWVNDSLTTQEHLALLRPYDPDDMEAHEVSKRLNDVRNNDADLKKPFTNPKPPEQSSLFN